MEMKILKISDLVAQLEDVKSKTGDIEVFNISMTEGGDKDVYLYPVIGVIPMSGLGGNYKEQLIAIMSNPNEYLRAQGSSMAYPIK